MWIWQALTGILLVVLLGLHMVEQHFIAEGGLRTYAEVIAYMQNPWVVVWEVVFLFVVIIHATLGVRSIALDTGLSPKAARRLTTVLVIVGLALLGYGLYLTFALLSLG